MDNFIEKQFIPFLANYVNYSDGKLALEAMKATKKMFNYYSVDNLVPPLTNALQHKNKDVAYFALDIIRTKPDGEKIESMTPAEYNELLLEVVLPFLNTCFEFISDDVVLNAMNMAQALSKDSEIEVPLFKLLEKMLKHKTNQIAHLALDIIRDLGVRKEVHIFEAV